MNKTTFVYGAGLALAAFGLQWLDYQHAVRLFATELYIILIAIGFTALGLWVGARLMPARPQAKFVANKAALAALQVTDREYEILQLLTEGLSNQEIANQLFVSINTVKSHVAQLYGKLNVSRRTQAVQKAKTLHLIG